MPWQRRDVIQLGLLILCVPLQYYISGYFVDVKDTDRSQIVISIMKSIDSIKEALFNFELWTTRWQDLFFMVFVGETQNENTEEDGSKSEPQKSDNADEEEEEEEDETDIDIEAKFNYLTHYSKVRDKRPDSVLYRVGQTVQLVNHAYRGVIIGWDFDEEISALPVYSILIDESHIKKDIASVIIQVPQDKLYVIRKYIVTHLQLKWYFTDYDGTQYIPRVWLKKLYPKD